MCKDQHGCRYLQKKLEERNAESVLLIFLETNQHVVELMTGVYSQKFLQHVTHAHYYQTRSEITCVKSCWSIPTTNNAPN